VPAEPLKASLWFDGAAEPNPGWGGAGFVVRIQGRPPEVHAVPLGRVTNNVAEWRALILVLRRARELGATHVRVFGDSQLVLRQVEGTYRVRQADLKPLAEEAKELLRGFAAYDVEWVPRAENAEADAASTEGVRLNHRRQD
jgi:ribonuclease HI